MIANPLGTRPILSIPMLFLLVAFAGCGTTNTRNASEQLLVSSAVDQSVARLDFRDLTGKSVYLNTEYIQNIKGIGFVNANYIISSLRQQLAAADCRLQDKREDAQYIVEARVGALGTDDQEVTVGIPKNNVLGVATAIVPGAPALPPIPEISFAKSRSQTGAAKIAVFAYHRETKQPIWQSGISLARSESKDTWLLGAGPFQRGAIYGGTRFAGARLGVPLWGRDKQQTDGPAIAFDKEVHFARPKELQLKSKVQVANFEEEESDSADDRGPGKENKAEPDEQE